MKYIKRINEYFQMPFNQPVNEGDSVIYKNEKTYTLKVRKVVDNWFTAEGCYGVFFEKSKILGLDENASVFDSNFVGKNDQKWRKVSKSKLKRIENKIQNLVEDLPFKEGDEFEYNGQVAKVLNYRWGEKYYNVIINGEIEIVRTNVLEEIKNGVYVSESIDTMTEYELKIDREYSKLKKGPGENLLDLGKITDVSKTDINNIKRTYMDSNVITKDGHYWLKIKGKNCDCPDKKKK